MSVENSMTDDSHSAQINDSVSSEKCDTSKSTKTMYRKENEQLPNAELKDVEIQRKEAEIQTRARK